MAILFMPQEEQPPSSHTTHKSWSYRCETSASAWAYSCCPACCLHRGYRQEASQPHHMGRGEVVSHHAPSNSSHPIAKPLTRGAAWYPTQQPSHTAMKSAIPSPLRCCMANQKYGLTWLKNNPGSSSFVLQLSTQLHKQAISAQQRGQQQAAKACHPFTRKVTTERSVGARKEHQERIRLCSPYALHRHLKRETQAPVGLLPHITIYRM